MFGIKKQKNDNDTGDNKIRKKLLKIIENIKKNKSYEDLKQDVLELSNEPNKEELMNNFIDKVNTFLDYSTDEEEEKEMNFPIDPWTDSFSKN